MRTRLFWTAMVGLAGCGGMVESEGDSTVATAERAAASRAATFKTALKGSFLSAENNGGGAVDATRAGASTWETFSLYDVNGGDLTDGDQIYLAAGNGQFLSAAGGGGAGSVISANRSTPLDWETFIVRRSGGGGVIHDGDQVALQTKTRGTYLSALDGGGGALVADRSAVSGWERFVVGFGGGSGGDKPPLAGRGATLPYWEYEAEDANTTGTLLGPSTTFGDVASEASGRRAVRLDRAGQRVQFTLAHPANSIVVRYSIPDAQPSGAPDPRPPAPTSTLGLYVGGQRRASLTLTSRYAWTYGDPDAQGAGSNVPGGTAHHFYDEAHLLFDEVPAGATIALQRDAQDGAAYYVIDLVDFEQVAPPLAQPSGSLSITDFGATPGDGSDDGPALVKAIAAARTQNKVLWIPKGVFDIRFDATADVTRRNIPISGITLRGAGMWHSVLQGFAAQFKTSGTHNEFHDFALFGDITLRDDTKGYQGFDGPLGSGARVENVWIEHVTAGMWIGHGNTRPPITQPLTDGLVVHGVRIRDTWADGVNLNDATANSVVEQSSLRNNGDDALASWSFSGDGPLPCRNNVFRFNTVQAVWRATCMALYGGQDNRMEDNLCSDTSNYPGLLAATTAGFQPLPFSGTTTLRRNTLVRAGGKHYGYDHGALAFFSSFNPISAPIVVSDIDIESPSFNGIQVEGPQPITGVSLTNVAVNRPATVGIWVLGGVNGHAQLSGVLVSGGSAGLRNDSPNSFSIARGAGNSGW